MDRNLIAVILSSFIILISLVGNISQFASSNSFELLGGDENEDDGDDDDDYDYEDDDYDEDDDDDHDSEDDDDD